MFQTKPEISTPMPKPRPSPGMSRRSPKAKNWSLKAKVKDYDPRSRPVISRPWTRRRTMIPGQEQIQKQLKPSRHQSLMLIQSSLPRDVAQSVACAIIGSRLDYCNSLYYGMSNTNFQRLQRVQNAAARIVCQAPRRQHHSADLLKDLHWLPVRSRVDYKIAVLCYKAVKLEQPSYLSSQLSPYRQSRVLRSSASDLLSTQSTSTNSASRRFSCCAPTVWNSLPPFVRTADSNTISFRSQLKTYVFARHLYSGTLSAPLIPLLGFSRVTNSLLTYLLSSLYLPCIKFHCDLLQFPVLRQWWPAISQ